MFTPNCCVAHVLVGELIVVTGPPAGAGKTTVSRILSHLFEPSARIAGEFFGFIDQGYLAPWTSASHRRIEIGPWFLDAFSDATGLPLLHYAILLPLERLCLDRVASSSRARLHRL